MGLTERLRDWLLHSFLVTPIGGRNKAFVCCPPAKLVSDFQHKLSLFSQNGIRIMDREDCGVVFKLSVLWYVFILATV